MPPEEIAAAAVYWLSDESRPISGSVVELEQYPGHRPQPAEEVIRLMPKLAAFPKAYMDPLCVDGTMTISRSGSSWPATLDIDGLEFYCGFLELRRPPTWARVAADRRRPGRSASRCSAARPTSRIPMRSSGSSRSTCEKGWIDMTVALGGQYCRVLSGQRRPEVSRDEGIRYAAECIEACLPHAAAGGVTLILENHYKDNYWQYPEFAQKMDVFCDLVDAIDLAALRRQLRSEQHDSGRRRSAGTAASA